MIFELVWAVSSLFFLSWAAYQDVKYRLIQDRIWLIQLIFSIILYFVWFNSGASNSEKLISIINIIMTFFFAFVFFYFGAFGGADSKALMVLSINSPLAYSFSLIKYNLITPYPSIMFILFNMVILFFAFAFSLLIVNILQIKSFGPLFQETNGTIMQKINILISSRRISSDFVDSIRFHDPAEVFDGLNWKLSTPIFEAPLDDDEFERREKEMKEKAVRDIKQTGKTQIWMRPQPPGILFILISQFIWIVVGSPFVSLLKYYESN